jgi:glycosyltransferase involved in cell wall biosynthesis
MHILSVMNVTNRESISTDSGYVFYDLLAPHLSKDHDFTMVGPAALSDENSNHIFMDLGRNKYEARFSFQWDKMSQTLIEQQPDVLIVNQIELLPNYKALCMAINIDPVIVGYSHYVPYGFFPDGDLIVDPSLNKGGIASAIKNNYLSGIQTADQVFIHSETGVNFISTACKVHALDIAPDKIKIVPPPFDPMMIEEPKLQNKRDKVVYNHRLYGHYGTGSFVDLSKRINNETDLKVEVFDTLGQRSPERVKLDNSVEILRGQLEEIDCVDVINDGGDRGQYKKNLSGALCSIAPNKPTAVWAMSCIDSMGMGVPVVAPNTAWFAEFVPKDLQFNNDDQAMHIITKLYKDDKFWLEKSEECKQKISRLAPKKIADKFLNNFSEALEKKNANLSIEVN